MSDPLYIPRTRYPSIEGVVFEPKLELRVSSVKNSVHTSGRRFSDLSGRSLISWSLSKDTFELRETTVLRSYRSIDQMIRVVGSGELASCPEVLSSLKMLLTYSQGLLTPRNMLKSIMLISTPRSSTRAQSRVTLGNEHTLTGTSHRPEAFHTRLP